MDIDPTTNNPSARVGHVAGGRAPGGGFPVLQGASLDGDYGSGTIRDLSKSAGVWENSVLAATPHRISAIGEDEAGTLYMVDYGTGNVCRVTVP